MKEFSLLTNEEIYDLTPEAIDTYKKLVLAENGVKFPENPIKPQECSEKPDKMVYTIDGLSDKWNGLCFETIEDARDFVAFIIKAKGIGFKTSKYDVDSSTYYFETGLPRDWNGNIPSLNIGSESVFSKEKYKEVENGIKKYRTEKAAYECALKEFEKAIQKAKELTESIDKKISEVREDINHKEYLTHKLKSDYLPLAEGNVDIAIKFLDKAYSLTESDKDYILSHIDAE